MALFGRVCKCITTVNGASFVALIEVRSRKNGKPRFLVYRASFNLSVSNDGITKELPEYIFTECIDIKDAQQIFGEYRRGVIHYFRPAPYGFYRFMVRREIFKRDKADTVIDFFPRWITEGKRSGRRKEARAPKQLQLEFGNLFTILSLRQRELSRRRNLLTAYSEGLSPEECNELNEEIAFMAQEVKVAYYELKGHILNQQEVRG